jgi:deoxyribodipyrimidine photo-lyase
VPVIPLFVRDEHLLKAGTMGPRRLVALDSAVAALDRDLRAVGGRLVIRAGDPRRVVPELVHETGATRVHVTREHTPYARDRDAAISRQLQLVMHDGALLVEPEAIGPTRVFSAFHRQWARFAAPKPFARPKRVSVPEGVSSMPAPPVAPSGELEAFRRLSRFAVDRSVAYDAARDRLDLEGTSRLGSDIHFGTISVGRVYEAVDEPSFRRQLAWRDWAHHILWFRPEVRWLAWRADLRDLRWREDPSGFAAWSEGRTGYPTVDAAMRQLASEGWISNRARMIAASFLAKDLLIDWRRGERHFLRNLADADVANNSLGWQWVAGIGTDAAPYHRILNPARQGERFDPHGTWVRRWVPEVADLPDALIHRPWDASPDAVPRYPRPLVEHRFARERAMVWFRDKARSDPTPDQQIVMAARDR